jgi:hypothetical protein
MAWSEVASRKATAEFVSVSTFSLALGGNVSSGNLITCSGAIWNDPQTSTITASSTQHATGWQVDKLNVGTAVTIFHATRVASASGAETITIDPDGTTHWGSMSVDEFAAGNTISASVSAQTATGSSTAPGVSITTTSSVSLILAVYGSDGALYPNPITTTPNAGYTQFGEIESTENANHNAVYRAVNNDSWTPSWTCGTSNVWGALALAYEEAAGGGGLVHRALMLGVGI